MTRVNKLANHIPTLKVGLGGNHYVFCTTKEPLEEVCVAIGKSIQSIYYRSEHNCWVIRIKAAHHKKLLVEIVT